MIKKIKKILLFNRSTQHKAKKIYGDNVDVDDTTQIFECKFEDNIKLGKESIFMCCEFGRYTYFFGFNSGVYAKVGRFCSIARGVNLGLGLHPVDMVSTSPVFFSKNTYLGKSFSDKDYIQTSKPVSVGNDVWIGVNAQILDGVTIGDGAIIGAGAVVTKDVKPYSIVAGIPAKLIRMRFNDKEIKSLLDSKWWDKDINWIKENFKKFHHLENYIDMVNKENLNK